MAIPGLDSDKCAIRNRIAAKKGGLEAVQLRLGGPPESWEERENLAAHGKLPQDTSGVMAAIQSFQPEGAEKLTSDDVYVHFAEAANTNFVGDRYLFLGLSTLKNCAKDAAKGVAFMNSHRTGGFSQPSELPFGRTFAGRYEELSDGQARVMLGVYMLRGQKPTGENGPSTDDLDAGIRAGTINDVSVGLWGGDAVCDVCGEDMNARSPDGCYLCPHLPGTDLGMTAKEKASQQKRGIKTGYATYTLENARMGEVSAVFDGAVPGAGFRKALALARTGLPTETLAQCRTAYAGLVRKHDFANSRAEVSAEELVKGLLALDETEDVGTSPAGVPFEQELEGLLAAVNSSINRARDVHAHRVAEGRTLSATRWQQLSEVRDALTALLQETEPRQRQLNRLRLKALQLRAERLSA